MAKATDQLAGKVGTKVATKAAGGVLPGLLADEKSLDRRALWRLGVWAAVAITAVTAAMIASQYATAMRQDEATAIELARHSRQIAEGQSESRRLASAVDTLNGDRDRLFARVTVLEQGLETLAGARPRPSAAAAPAAVTPLTASAEPPATAPAPAAAAPATSALPKPAQASANPAPPEPAGTALATARLVAMPGSPTATPASPMAIAKSAIGAMVRSTDAGKAAAPDAATTPAPVSQGVVELPAPATGTATPNEKRTAETMSADQAPTDRSAAERPATGMPAQQAAANPAPLVAAKSMLGPPDAAAGKWVEPAKPDATAPDVVGSIGHGEADPAQGASARFTVKHTEFGVDMGSASSVGGLRAMWLGLLKANPALSKLVPIIVVRENSTGLGLQLRLVAGPLDDAAAAAKICAGLAETRRSCEPTLFDGQRLALKAEDETDPKNPDVKNPDVKNTDLKNPDVRNPDVKNAEARAAVPRSMMHRRYNYRRVVVPVDDTAKKPETSFSSLFNRH